MVLRDLKVPGNLVFVGGRSATLTGSGSGSVSWRNVYIVDAAGGGDFTTIQAAITAAAAASPAPSATNPWLVLITGGLYTETLTLSAHVHVSGVGRAATRIDHSAGTLTSVDNVTISNLTFQSNNVTPFTFSHSVFRLVNVRIDGTGGGSTVTASDGVFEDVQFLGIGVTLSGASMQARPVFNACFVALTSSLPGIAGSGYGFWDGCAFSVDGSASSNVGFGLSTKASFSGCSVMVHSGGVIVSGTYTGCRFHLTGQSSSNGVSMSVTGPAIFSGCHISQSGSYAGANGAAISLVNTQAGSISFVGCDIRFTSPSFGGLFFFTAGFSSAASVYPVTFDGCNIETTPDVTYNGSLFEFASGITGNVVVNLNGCRINAGFFSSLPVSTASGGVIRWMGNNVILHRIPVITGTGTGAMITVDHKPCTELNAVTETAFCSGRVSAPAGGLVDATLLLSAEHDDGIENDTFTDVNGTDLTAHTSDTGGSWTARSGTFQVQGNVASNQALAGTISLYTYSIGTANGLLIGEPNLTTSQGGLVFRWADSSNYWRAITTIVGSGRLRLIKRVAGVETTVADVAPVGTPLTVSFVGDQIRVWLGDNLLIDVADSALSANTGVGLYGTFIGSGSRPTIDNFFFYPGGTVDITTEVKDGAERKNFDRTASVVSTSVPVVHNTYVRHSIVAAIDSAIVNGPGEDLIGARVTLDALGTDIVALRVHGIEIRTLSSVNENGTRVPASGVPYR